MKTKEQRRHISIIIASLIFEIITFGILLYFYHSSWEGVYIVDNVPTSLTGVGIIIIISLTIIAFFVLSAILLGIYFPPQPKSKKQINLPNDFVQVRVKDFDKLPLSAFIPKEDFYCMAKIDQDGNIIYLFNLKSNFHQTDNFDLFTHHFDV